MTETPQSATSDGSSRERSLSEVFGLADLIDSPAERAFDRITRLASSFLHSPISLISVVDERRNFFKSIHGVAPELNGAREIPVSHSYCRHVQASGTMLAVGDTLGHPVVGANPTNAEFGIRAYLGFPVFDSDSKVACTLCVLDRVPRRWSDEDIALMRDLVEILETELALRQEVRVRRASEDRNVLLVREMEHRIKNSLSTVQAIIGLSLRTETDLDSLRRTLQERIASMAQTHGLLLEGNRQGATARSLLHSELGHFDADENLTIVAGEDYIPPQDAVVFGLVVHELTTNAAKYGALHAKGRLAIHCWTVSRDGQRWLRLEWRETGVTITASPDRKGFGSTLLDTLIVRQYGGEIERNWMPEGLHLVMAMPLTEQEPD